MKIVEITTGKSAVCREVLATLPHWFGIPASNDAYAAGVESLPMFGCIENGETRGFVSLKPQTAFATECYVLGVKPQFHRKGIGRALMLRAEDHLRRNGARFFTVKTRGPSKPDAGYEKTRAFYQAMGFFPLEEFPLLWDEENPCLFMAKALGYLR